ncbi:helix-turn-helix domain-containing protein [Paenibacillus sp. 481]|uniref:helix-turn-helix domain-containing protein n=1 Tax=Paenibacillus sp. 481 TaxID=2835869 RepID=UPI001E3E71B6|nr:helix-turn-helix transcriptional regulator [Paenibacillus sp. 481]
MYVITVRRELIVLVPAPIRTLRSEIEHQMKIHNYTLSKLSQQSGINNGHLSLILNANPPRPMTIKQLDAIGRAFDQPEGWLYELYSEECFRHEKVSRPRVIPYFIKCVQIGRFDCVEAVVSIMLEDLKSSLLILFEVAEQLFHTGLKQESIPFYRYVIENERNNFSDIFVMSQYRLFVASQGLDAEENWRAVIRFEPYRKRLPENIQLDAHLKLANLCFTLQKWKDMERYADELRELATILYKNELRKKNSDKISEPLKATYHLVAYYGLGFLLKALALKHQGFYEQSKEYTLGYADLSWFETLDETGQFEVKRFQLWAKGNLFTLDMLIGNIGVLPDYLQYLRVNPHEILPGLVTIVKAANMHTFQIEDVLHEFSYEISRFDKYEDVFKRGLHLRFRFDLATYYFQRGKYVEGIDTISFCIALCQGMNSDETFLLECIKLYEEHKFKT